MDQEKVVTWYVLVTEGTYSVVMEDKMCRRIVPEIVFSGRSSLWIKGEMIKRLIASETLQFEVCCVATRRSTTKLANAASLYQPAIAYSEEPTTPC